MDPLAPGREIGKYRVVRRLAIGGMAEIYLAQARGIEGFEKFVVLKRILPQYAASETFVRLFLNEARLTATLSHPNVAAVYDIGEAEGVYFFTMEYLHGEDLGYILRHLARHKLRVPIEHALTIGAGVAAGLHAAHEKVGVDGKPLGIVHRDVSPSNVVVTYDGGVKLVDFGVAKVTATAELTGTGTLKGKLAYMSPEQCNNEPVDRRSDVYSLGVLLYELTTQSRLFKADSEAGTVKLVMEARIPPPSSRVPDFPPQLEPVLYKALSRDRDQRYASGREVELALEQVARERGLLTSTARLAEWMVATFGAKPEPWTAPQRLVLPRPGDDPDRAGDEEEDAPAPAPRVALQRGPVLPTLGAQPAVAADALPGGRKGGLRRILLAGLGLAALGAAAIVGLRGSRGPHEAPAAASAVLVLAEQGPVALEPAPAGPAERSPAPSPAPAAARRPPERERAPRPDSIEARTRRFSAAFARKQQQLQRCFAEFPEASAQAPQLYVRFQAGEDGRVTSAEVLPAEIARSGLGTCVAGVAAQTQFGPQPAPVAFRIPVTVRRVGEPRKP
jgi:tRNA A-37 threonylcarbamoyl transferase component Bud32